MKKMVLLIACISSNVCFFSAHANTKTTFMQLSRSCVKIWSVMRDLVDNSDAQSKEITVGEDSPIEHLDDLLCKTVRVRDMIKSLDFTSSADSNATAYYIDSVLDCVGQYTYDLVKQYPGSWSSVIQEQVFRAQEAYAQSMTEHITN